MIPEVAQFLLVLALVNNILPFMVKNSPSIKYIHLYGCLCVTAAFLVLAYLMFFVDTSVAYVVSHSNSSLPWFFRLSSVWGGHEGSLLLWSLIGHVYGLLLVWNTKGISERQKLILSRLASTYNIATLSLVIFISNPFVRVLKNIPVDGADLNPSLQDIALIIHPPILYIGYVGMGAVYALAMTLFISNASHAQLLSRMRKYLYFSWGALTLGITLGSWWAYYELGWGGWWFWDPAENAALVPWLLGVALIHSLYSSRKGSHWLLWSFNLAIVLLISTLVGTFIIRSGIISSVHSFSVDLKKANFLGLTILLYAIFSFVLYMRYQKNFKQPAHIRGTNMLMLAVNVFCFAALAFVVSSGTLYPLLYELITGSEVSVSPGFFNEVGMLLLLPALLFLIWSLISNFDTKRKILSLSATLVVMLPIALYASLSILAAGAVTVGILLIFSELIRWSQGQKGNTGRALSHVSIGLFIIGVAVVSTSEVELEQLVQVNDGIALTRNINVSLQDVSVKEGSNYISYFSTVHVEDSDGNIKVKHPEKRYYYNVGQSLTEVALVVMPLYDVYLGLGDLRDGGWTMRLAYKPLIRFIWLSGILIFMAAMVLSMRRQDRA